MGPFSKARSYIEGEVSRFISTLPSETRKHEYIICKNCAKQKHNIIMHNTLFESFDNKDFIYISSMY